MKSAQTVLLLTLFALGGCSFYARSPDDYRTATREVLEKKNDKIEDCYKSELAANENAKGKVVVRFDVEAKTGSLVKVKVVDNKTDASEGLQKCVVDALDGLKLDPPDERTGEATFEWEFGRAKR